MVPAPHAGPTGQRRCRMTRQRCPQRATTRPTPPTRDHSENPALTAHPGAKDALTMIPVATVNTTDTGDTHDPGLLHADWKETTGPRQPKGDHTRPTRPNGCRASRMPNRYTRSPTPPTPAQRRPATPIPGTIRQTTPVWSSATTHPKQVGQGKGLVVETRGAAAAATGTTRAVQTDGSKENDSLPHM